jgi:hypothetical protein
MQDPPQQPQHTAETYGNWTVECDIQAGRRCKKPATWRRSSKPRASKLRLHDWRSAGRPRARHSKSKSSSRSTCGCPPASSFRSTTRIPVSSQVSRAVYPAVASQMQSSSRTPWPSSEHPATKQKCISSTPINRKWSYRLVLAVSLRPLMCCQRSDCALQCLKSAARVIRRSRRARSVVLVAARQ